MVISSGYSQNSPVKGRPTIFGNICEKNVVFVIDTSGSMYHSLDVVKEHLLEVIISRATSGRDTMFNVISFDESVTRWADRLVQCTPRTVSSASQWIHQLKCGTSTNTMEALLQAYEDDGLDAVYLVTDGLPDQRTAVILENIRRIHNGRPVHGTYITGTHSDLAAMEFLESLARETKGSLHVISLTLTGSIKKVTPVYNEKTSYVRNYEGSFLDHIAERPSSAPPQTSGLLSYRHDPSRSVTILHAPHGPVPIPYVRNTCYVYDKPRGYSKVLDYADSVLASRGLAQFVDRPVSSVPVAASIIIGMKLLARREADGLFYMATIKEQATNENFILDFHKCPSLQQAFIQETPIHDCIAVKDAKRQPICIGDKVLAPWQPDGRYGPGTVLDGVDRRDLQPQPPGFEHLEGGNLLVAFFNGESKEVGPGVAVRTPLKVFNRLVTELQMPKHQRRQIRLASKSTTPEYTSISPALETTWQRPFSPPKTSKKISLDESDSLLKAKIEYQLQRNRHLLSDIRVKEKLERTNERGVSGLLNRSGKSVQFDDNGELDVQDKYYRSYRDHETIITKDENMERIDVGVETNESDFNKLVGRTVKVGVPLSKAGGKPEKKKRWRSWSSGIAPRPPRFRETLMSKASEAKDEKPSRPCHQEYQTADGVAFPRGTDKKLSSGVWHPYHGHVMPEQKPRSDQVEPKLKHNEYRSSSGVPFPPAADRKFASGTNPNWSPDNAGKSVARSTCWEDGLGEVDKSKILQRKQNIERKRHVAEQYNERIRKDVIDKETKESERLDNHRNTTLQRNNHIAENVAEIDRKRSVKFDFKKQVNQNTRENEDTKELQVEVQEGERMAAMKNRMGQHQKMEQSFEVVAQNHNQQRQDGLKEREQKRYKSHHNRLVSERQSVELREQRLKEQATAQEIKLQKTKSDSERNKEMRLSIKRQNRDKFVAEVL